MAQLHQPNIVQLASSLAMCLVSTTFYTQSLGKTRKICIYSFRVSLPAEGTLHNLLPQSSTSVCNSPPEFVLLRNFCQYSKVSEFARSSVLPFKRTFFQLAQKRNANLGVVDATARSLHLWMQSNFTTSPYCACVRRH